MKLSGKIVAIVAMLASAQQAAAMGGSQTVSPRDAFDLNPDPDIVEVVLVAHENVVDFGTGNTTAVYTYNGGIPGPTIRGKVGDRLIVHFYNTLPEATTVHWHGLEIPANQDGSFLSQLPVEPYQYKRYEFDLNVASLFWYHPHIRSDEQIEKGLYGALLVEDATENATLDLPQSEHLLVLDDVLLDDNGQVAEHFSEMADPLARTKQILDGREGNLKTVNGVTQPVVRVKQYEPQRLRVVNTSNATFMRLSLSGHSGHTMHRIGGDGGLLEAPLQIHPIGCADDSDGGHDGHAATGVDSDTCASDPDINKGVLLTPGERADIVFTPMGKEPIHLEWHDIRKGRHTASYGTDGKIVLSHAHGDGAAPREVLMTFETFGGGKDEAYVPPAVLRDIPGLVADVTEPLVLKFGHAPPDANGDVKLFVQDIGKPFVKVTTEDAYDLEVGKTYIWETWNMTGGIHNFHPHGFSVQLIETVYVDMDKPEGEQMIVVPAPYLEWKDTVAMPARPGAPMRSRTVQRYAMKIDDTGREGQVTASGKVATDNESGGWLLHCHINEHSRNGMGTFFEVFESAE
jgi:FtsP/CotA-like multicopper oxidase with cupredoxin domain